MLVQIGKRDFMTHFITSAQTTLDQALDELHVFTIRAVRRKVLSLDDEVGRANVRESMESPRPVEWMGGCLFTG